jgi:rare lipoprotein A
MRPLLSLLAILGLTLVIVLPGAGCTRPAREPQAAPTSRPWTEKGIASWYGKKFHGRQTASGERYNMHHHTHAHKSLAFGTRVRVTNLDNGRRVVVSINDRGPFVKGRIIDLSYAAAREVGMINAGTARVRLEVIG